MQFIDLITIFHGHTTADISFQCNNNVKFREIIEEYSKINFEAKKQSNKNKLEMSVMTKFNSLMISHVYNNARPYN
jgi:hypothetical protein